MSGRLLDARVPRIYSIPPARDFAAAVAATLRQEFAADEDPEALTRVLILTPTRRAAKAIGDAFAEAAGAGVALLPVIRPLGDIDADDPPFEPGELAGIAPPALSNARRHFELARLILGKERALGRAMGVGGALALAKPLAELLDDLANEGVSDLTPLAVELAAHLPEDRREAIEFLSILQEAWPARLRELGGFDSAERRALILSALADRWRQTPPDHPVFVVGSTGSIPAVRRLMGVVAGLPQGAVVLPGFDWDMDRQAFEGIDDAHPQWAMRDFIAEQKLDPASIPYWPGASENPQERARRRIIAEALRPAGTTDEWLQRLDVLKNQLGDDFFETGLDGLTLIESPDTLSEARCCALLLRETLEMPERTAILVTPDRALARRVSTEMGRFGVRVDDSGGAALAECAAGSFLERLLDVALDPGSLIAQSSLWASKYFSAQLARGPVHTALSKAEAVAWRGVKPGQGFAGLRARLANRRVRLHPADRELTEQALDTEATALSDLVDGGVTRVADWAERHILAAEALATTPDQPGAVRFWAGEDGEAAAMLMRDLLQESDALPEMSLADYRSVFRDMARARRVPPRLGVHPRVQILGPLEARLIAADRVILAGLNEGVWPAGIGADPWMSRGMRAAVALGAPERRHGLAAHDFAQLAASADVVLTRSEKADGAPTVASRWIWRLQTLVSGALGSQTALTQAGRIYPALAARLDAPSHAIRPAPAPHPTPPVSIRPRQLSITEIRTWIRDPYSIFCKHVLGLRRLDPADMTPSHRERGTALHAVLETAVAGWQAEIPENAVDQLIEMARTELLQAGFEESDLGIELPRFARAARWLLAWEHKRRRDGVTVEALETWLEAVLSGPEGAWTLRGKADRIDRSADGRLDILDYKTGSAATADEVAVGFDPQLPLTAALLRRAESSATIAPSDPSALIYLRLSGAKEAGGEQRIDGRGRQKKSATELAEAAMEDLLQLIARFDDETTPYLSQPRAKFMDDYSDYNHLARRGEWAMARDDGEGDG